MLEAEEQDGLELQAPRPGMTPMHSSHALLPCTPPMYSSHVLLPCIPPTPQSHFIKSKSLAINLQENTFTNIFPSPPLTPQDV